MIILLCGKPGSGKDTFADWLVKNKGYSRKAFADELKKEVSKIYNIPLEYFHERDLKDKIVFKDKTPRMLCIEYATEKREQDPLYWIKKIDVSNKTVITDCRFFNERDYFKNSVSVWIHRPDIPFIEDNGQLSYKDCEHIIYNRETPFNGKDMWNQLSKHLKSENCWTNLLRYIEDNFC